MLTTPAPSRELSRDRWPNYFDQFSRIHRGQPITVETTFQPAGGPCPNARELPLIGITAEHDGERRINIMLGDSPDDDGHLGHSIERPTRIRIAEWNDGVSAAVEIESADHSTTVLRVGPQHQTLPPGIVVDGIL